MAALPTAKIRRPKSTTRSLILKHAHGMYLDGRLIPGDERLALVLRELGYTTGAGYQIWENQAAFRNELREHIAENIDYASLRSIAPEIAELHAQNLPFEEHVLAAGDLFIRHFLGREEFYIKLTFVALADGSPSRVTCALRDAYEQATCEAIQVFESTLARHGRRLREPLAMQDLVCAITASLEGFALRVRVQPEAVSEDLCVHGGSHHIFSAVFLTILNDFTESIPAGQ